MNDRFSSIQLFVRVARSASFSEAAREMGVTQPTASRIVAALEKQVGVALLTRNTRAVALTEAGAEYLARCEAILAALDEAEHAARGTGELRGTLRIATSHSLAVRTLIPRLSSFTDQHPKLRIEFMLADAQHDLIGESVDVALRIGTLSDSSIIARKIGTAHRVVVASPNYLKMADTPLTPQDLAHHSIIIGPAGRGPDAWTFRKDGKTKVAQVEGRFFINAIEAATAAAVAGLCILSTGQRSIQAELAAGDLVPVLSGWTMGSGDISVILLAGKLAKPSARAFAKFAAEMIAEIEAAFPWRP